MDSDRFDTLTRALHDVRSSRRAMAALGSVLGLALGGFSVQEAEAKKKACPPCKKRKQGKCKKKLPDGTACEGGRTCQNGTCTCPPDKPTFCPSQDVCGQCCDNLPCCGNTICGLREPTCLANRTCGCADGRPTCANTNLCCLAVEVCDEFIGGCVEPAPSDRNLKANFGSVDAADMLSRVQALPISTWNYTSDDAAIRHIGPMAQDFAALFGVGIDDRHIHPIDGHGVALAAIQGLLGELAQVREANAQLAARLERLEAVSGLDES